MSTSGSSSSTWGSERVTGRSDKGSVRISVSHTRRLAGWSTQREGGGLVGKHPGLGLRAGIGRVQGGEGRGHEGPRCCLVH